MAIGGRRFAVDVREAREVMTMDAIGSVQRDEALLLGTVLTVYAASLIGSAVQRALQAPFFARLDTSTPLRTTVYGVIANLVALPLAMKGVDMLGGPAVVGVPIAFTIGVYTMAVQAAYRVRVVAGSPWQGLGWFTLRLGLASAAGGAAMFGLERWFDLDTAHERLVELAYTNLVFVGIPSVGQLSSTRRSLGPGVYAPTEEA